jgi:hypothetical protein
MNQYCMDVTEIFGCAGNLPENIWQKMAALKPVMQNSTFGPISVLDTAHRQHDKFAFGIQTYFYYVRTKSLA